MSAHPPPETAEPPTSETNRQQILAALHELIDALDRRVPQPDRAGEHAIARDAAGLRKAAQDRISQLLLS
jgi:hypothetical protein